MRKLILIVMILALGIIVYNQVKTPDEIKVIQEMTEICGYNTETECD